MDWIPTLTDREGPVYLRIVAALSADIESGRLVRTTAPYALELAKTLGIDLTTVTRAYTEAQRRGLTQARIRQVTCVVESLSCPRRSAGQPPEFDLSMILPPQPLDTDLEGRLMRGLAAIQREAGLCALLTYRDAGACQAERNIAAEWLRSRIANGRGDRLVICPGTQNAIFNLLETLMSPGDVVLTEALTYPGIRAAAGYAAVRLVGVPMDDDGVVPAALEAACRPPSFWQPRCERAFRCRRH
jgi:DNA-binding transcriptional MocR family regulator